MSDKKSPLAERVSIFLQALQVLALISGGVWFLLEYSWNIKNAQREESLKYAAKAYEANMTSDLALMGRPFQDTSFAPKMRAVLKESYKGKDICPVEEFYRTQILPLY